MKLERNTRVVNATVAERELIFAAAKEVSFPVYGPTLDHATMERYPHLNVSDAVGAAPGLLICGNSALPKHPDYKNVPAEEMILSLRKMAVSDCLALLGLE